MARECAETKILRIPSRRAQRALVRVAPAARKLDLREQRGDALCSLASRQEEREEDKGAEEKGRGRERKRERRRSRDERPQSTQHRPAKIAWNTPGIYYPHGCSCGRRRPPLGREVAGTGTAPRGREACPRWITKGKKIFKICPRRDHPEL